MLKHDYYECICQADEHRLVVTYFPPDPEWPEEHEIYFNVHLNPEWGFWRRLWMGLKYAFGHHSNQGHFYCTSLEEKDMRRLRAFLNERIGEIDAATN